jgi:hypothetical protein
MQRVEWKYENCFHNFTRIEIEEEARAKNCLTAAEKNFAPC